MSDTTIHIDTPAGALKAICRKARGGLIFFAWTPLREEAPCLYGKIWREPGSRSGGHW